MSSREDERECKPERFCKLLIDKMATDGRREGKDHRRTGNWIRDIHKSIRKYTDDDTEEEDERVNIRLISGLKINSAFLKNTKNIEINGVEYKESA